MPAIVGLGTTVHTPSCFAKSNVRGIVWYWIISEPHNDDAHALIQSAHASVLLGAHDERAAAAPSRAWWSTCLRPAGLAATAAAASGEHDGQDCDQGDQRTSSTNHARPPRLSGIRMEFQATKPVRSADPEPEQHRGEGEDDRDVSP